MKTIYQLFSEFKQLSNPTDDDYMKLGHDLSTNIVFAPENQHALLWHFINAKFPKDKNELINYGAKFYSQIQMQKQVNLDKLEENIVVEKPNEPILQEKEIEETILKLEEELIDPREKEHKELITKRITQVKENIEKLDNTLTSLKTIKDPGFAMKKAIESLDKYKNEVNTKYKKPKK